MASEYQSRIDDLASRAERERVAFEAPADPPDEDRALRFLREGLGPTLAIYLEARTGDDLARFGTDEFDRLERATSTWLELYAACYGEHVTADHSVRTAAQLLVDTHDVVDVAQVLTDVPSRR